MPRAPSSFLPPPPPCPLLKPTRAPLRPPLHRSLRAAGSESRAGQGRVVTPHSATGDTSSSRRTPRPPPATLSLSLSLSLSLGHYYVTWLTSTYFISTLMCPRLSIHLRVPERLDRLSKAMEGKGDEHERRGHCVDVSNSPLYSTLLFPTLSSIKPSPCLMHDRASLTLSYNIYKL